MHSSYNNVKILLYINFFQSLMFSAPISTVYRLSSGLNIVDISRLNGLQTILFLFFLLPWGIITDKIGYKKTFIVCSVCNLMASFLFWKSASLPFLIIERVFSAVSQAGLLNSSSAMLFESTPIEKRQQAFSWYNAAGACSMMLSALIYSLLLNGNMSLAAMLSLIPCILALLLSFALSEIPVQARKPDSYQLQWSEIADFFRSNRSFSFYLLAIALFEETARTVTMLLNQPLYQAVGIPLDYFGYILAAVRGLLILVVFSPNLVRRFDAQRLSAFYMLMGALSCILLAMFQQAIWVLSGIILFRLCYGFFLPLRMDAQNQQIKTASRVTMLAVFMFPIKLCGVLVQISIIKLSQASIPAAMVLSAGLCLLACLLFYCWRQLQKTELSSVSIR